MSYSRDAGEGGKALSSQKPAPSSGGGQTTTTTTPNLKRVPSTQPPQEQSSEETIQESTKKKASVSTAEIQDYTGNTGAQGATTEQVSTAARQRQVIAVSASKGATVYFNLARKFLMQDDVCDLSALEAAIVVAIDTASLLQRSQLATITRIKTSYVIVEPRYQKKRQAQQLAEQSIGNEEKVPAVANPQIQSSHSSLSISDRNSSTASPSPAPATIGTTTTETDRNEPLLPPIEEKVTPAGGNLQLNPIPSTDQDASETTLEKRRTTSSSVSSTTHDGRKIRRAQLIITVQRTEAYTRWLEENPITAVASKATTPSDKSQDIDDDIMHNLDDDNQQVSIGGGHRQRTPSKK